MIPPPERNRTVFIAAGREITVWDVVDAAGFRGELAGAWNQLAILLGAGERAAGLEVDEEVAQATSEKFRSERGLITAEETESWLDQRGLTTDDFSDYFVRHYWDELFRGQITASGGDYLSAAEELRDLLRVELWFSGEFARLAGRLSWRYAALDGAPSGITPELIEAEGERFRARAGLEAGAVAAWLYQMGRDQRWLEEMLALEAAYHRECAAATNLKEQERMLREHRISWTRVELETVDLDSPAAAREALLCAREDETSLLEIATEGRYPHRRATLLIEEFAPERQPALLCGAPGEVLEPWARAEGFQLCRILRKIEPALADPVIHERVERLILERHFSELTTQHIRWSFGL